MPRSSYAEAKHWIGETERLGAEADEALGAETAALKRAEALGAESDRLLAELKQVHAALDNALADSRLHRKSFEDLAEAARACRQRAEQSIKELAGGDRVAIATA